MVNKGIKIIAGFDTYATAYYSACLNSRGLSGPLWRSVSKDTSPLPQTSIRMPGILLSLLVSNGQ